MAEASGFLGSGDLYMERTIASVAQGMLPAGNATKFEIKESSDNKQRVSRGRADYGQLKDSVYIKKPSTLQVVLDEVNAENMAVAFLGTVSAISQSSGTVTDEAHNGVKQGQLIELAKRNVSTVVVTDDAGTPVTFTVDVDYIVNARLGAILIVNGGGIDDGTNLKVDYAYATVTGKKIVGAVQPSIRLRFLLDGKNLTNEESAIVTVYDARVTPTSPVDFLADDFTKLTLDGTLRTPAGYASPYIVETELNI